ncbi:hypothetical protein [Kribbella sp. VKM Ac-2568]|uniref:hypothetical protein n=1 Tax=Kribbella sp. VKM Ac-2568 TaxID=2512219 RepID=UPI0010CE5D18|nr:hypothetical protein [Kribbella sp. VKM Ac-2568]TCM36933.1 methane/phenol/toluene hydroxylase [Kribbella sp. VKM Ac-2568]
MSRQSLIKAHAKMTELWWEPTFATAAARFGTDYTFETVRKKDPLRQIMRSCFPMEEEKGNRVHGAMDGAIRGNMFRQVQQRWLEWQKLFLSIIPFPEISAADLCLRLSSGARGVAVRQHCEDLCRSLRAASCVGWAYAEGVGSAVAGADDRDDLVSRTDRPPCHRDHDTAAGELEAISHRMPDLTSDDGTGRYRPPVEMSLEVAGERCCVSSQADLSATVPNSFSSCAMNHASSRKEATSPRLTRCRLRAGWTESRMDDVIHVAISPVDTDVSDLWSLR